MAGESPHSLESLLWVQPLKWTWSPAWKSSAERVPRAWSWISSTIRTLAPYQYRFFSRTFAVERGLLHWLRCEDSSTVSESLAVSRGYLGDITPAIDSQCKIWVTASVWKGLAYMQFERKQLGMEVQVENVGTSSIEVPIHPKLRDRSCTDHQRCPTRSWPWNRANRFAWEAPS